MINLFTKQEIETIFENVSVNKPENKNTQLINPTYPTYYNPYPLFASKPKTWTQMFNKTTDWNLVNNEIWFNNHKPN